MTASSATGSIIALTLVAALGVGGFEPPHSKDGSLPQILQQTSAWGQVLLEVSVGAAGAVEKATILRSSPPFAEVLQKTVVGWRFEPATVGGTPSRGRVLVGAIYSPTLPDAPGLGEPPRDLAEPSDSIPFPTSIVTPLYPPRALRDGVVLLEVMVGADGKARTATVLRSASGFDESADQASLQWKFRPRGATVPPSPQERSGVRVSGTDRLEVASEVT